MSIEAGCDVKAEDAHKEILESVNQGIFTLSTQSPSSELKHDHESNEPKEPESRHEAQNVNADELRIQSLVNAPRNSPILPMPTPQIKKDDIFIDSPPCQEMTPPNHKPLTSSARRSKSRKRRSSGGTINRTLNARIEDSIVDHDNLESVLPDSD